MKTFLTILLVSSAVANTTATNCKLFDANNATIDVQNGLSIQGLNVAMKAGTEFATLTTENVELFSISDSTYITVNLDKDSQILTFSTTLEFENYQRFETNKEIEIFIQNFKCSDGDAVTGFASPMFVFPLKFSNIYPPEFLVDDMVVESVTFNISMPFPKISLTKNYHSIYAIDMDLQNNNISFELDEIGKKYLEMTPTQLKNGLRTNYSIDLTPITVLNIETELAIHLNAWDSGNPSMNSSLEILFTSDVKATTPISPWFKEAFYLADMSDLTSQTITKDTIQPISFSSSITLQEGYDEQLTIYLSGDSNDSFIAELNTNLPVPSVEINLVGTPSEELLQLPFITFELMAVRDGALKPGRTAIFIKLPGSLCVEPTTTTESPTTVTTECDCPTEETTTIEPCPTTFIPELTTPCPDCICTTETTESSIAGQTTTTSGETTPEGNSTPVSTATTTSGQTSPSSELTTQCPTLPECDCSADTTESSVAGQTTSGETTSEGNSTPEIISSSVPDQKTSSSGLTTEYPPIPECSSTTETSLMPDKTSSSTGETSKSTKNTSTSVTYPITPSTDEPSYCTPCPSPSDICPTTSCDTPQDCSSYPTQPSEPSSDTSSTGQTDEPSHCTPCPSPSDQCPTTSCDTPQDCSSCPTQPSDHCPTTSCDTPQDCSSCPTLPSDHCPTTSCDTPQDCSSCPTLPSDHCPTTSCDTPQDCSSCPTQPSEPSSDTSSTGQTGSTTSTPVMVKFQLSLYVFPSISQDNEGIRIGRVEADITGTSELPSYYLEDNENNFVINSSNGDITVKQSIDPGTWVVSVVATCEGVVDKTQVQVTVSNFVNCLNNETKLVNTLLTMEFPEESEQTIYDIPEPDVLNCNWRKVSEEPLSGTDGFYVVYENGTILTSGIDREDNIFKNMSVAEVLLQVNISCPNDETHSEATSDGTSDRSKPWYPLRNLRNSDRDMYFLTVITDINDNNPEFEGTNPLIVGYPDAKVVKQLLPQNVATVKATDKDIGINALIRYEIEKSDVSSWFVIHPHTGVIYPNENHFQFKDAEFNVIAKDLDGGPGCLQSEKLVVKMKILAIEHLSVLSIEGKLVEDANETVLAIGNSLNYSVKVLLSAVVPSIEATIRSSSSSSLSRVLRAGEDTQSSLLYMVIYAIDKTTQEPVPAKTFNNQLASSNPSWKVSQLSSSASQGSTGSSESNGGLLGGVIALAVILILLLGGAGVAYYVLRVRRRKNTQIVDYDNFTAADSDSISRENHIIEEIPYLEKPAEVTTKSIFNEYDEIMPTDSTNVNEEDTSRPTYQNNIALSFDKDFSLIKDEDGDRKQSFTLQGSESEETSDEPHDDRQRTATDTINEGRDEEMLDLSSKSIVKFNDNVELIEIERL